VRTIILIFIFSLPIQATALVRLEPENPIAGQAVRLYYMGCEPPFPHIDSGELYYTEQNDNLVQFVGFFTFSLPLCPIIYEQYYDLGAFEAGEYELEVYLFLADEILPIDLDIRTPNEIINFGVMEPVQVPTIGTLGLNLMLLLIISIAFMYRGRIKI